MNNTKTIGVIVSIALGFGGCVLNIANYFHAREQDQRASAQATKEDLLGYIEAASAQQPQIRLVGKPQIMTYQVVDLRPSSLADGNMFRSWVRYFEPDSSTPKDSMEIAFRLEILFRYEFKNVQPYPANVIHSLYLDTLTSLPVLREDVSGNSWTGRSVFSLGQPFFPTREVRELDTTSFFVVAHVRRPADNQFAVHILVAYDGPNGALFDTYIVSRYEVSVKDGRFDVLPPLPGQSASRFRLPDSLDCRINFLDGNEENWIYPPAVASVVRTRLLTPMIRLY